MSIYDFSAASGPPTRKGDKKGQGFGSTVDAMKVGLRAHYAKAGTPVPPDNSTRSLRLNEDTPSSQQRYGPSVTKEALKTGLRAWYKKRGENITETTVAPSVGDGTARSLGSGFIQSRRQKSYIKGGTSLRTDIKNLEQSLERTLASLSNRRHISDSDDGKFRNLLVDALARLVLDGDKGYFKDALMHASLLESKFIGKAIPETGSILTPSTDLGEAFRNQMNGKGPMVEMIANQLSGGMPLNIVVNNVVASYNSTSNSGMRQTLQSAHNVLLGMR